MFPPGLANLKRNPDENPGVDLIPLKSVVFFKQTRRAVQLPIWAGSRSRSESDGINMTKEMDLENKIKNKLKEK